MSLEVRRLNSAEMKCARISAWRGGLLLAISRADHDLWSGFRRRIAPCERRFAIKRQHRAHALAELRPLAVLCQGQTQTFAARP